MCLDLQNKKIYNSFQGDRKWHQSWKLSSVRMVQQSYN